MTSTERCDKAANSCYNEGLHRARERELSAAVPYLKRALQLNKKHTDARNLLGLIYYELGEVGDALKQWVLSMSLSPDENRAVLYLDEIQRKKGRLRTYTHMINRYNAALELARHGSRDTALHQLSGVVAEHPNYVRAGLLLSLLLMEKEEWERAEQYLKQVLRTDVGNPDALRYLKTVEEHTRGRGSEKAREERRREKNSYSHRQMTDDEVIIPPTYRESTGWQTIMNIGIGLLIGAAAILFLYLPKRTAELNEAHNRELIAVSETLSRENAENARMEKEKEALSRERDDLLNQLNTFEESNTYQISQYQKLLGILDDFRNDRMAHAADLFATLDVTQLSDIDDDSGVSVTGIYQSVAERMSTEGHLSLYRQGEARYEAGDYEGAIQAYDKALLISPDYEPALFKKAMSFKQLGDIPSANNLFGEVILRFPDTELAASAKQERGY